MGSGGTAPTILTGG